MDKASTMIWRFGDYREREREREIEREMLSLI